MVVFPCCKINLGLHILNKRSDGFHNIETVLYPLPFTDVLEIIPDIGLPEGDVAFDSEGLKVGGRAVDNLVMRAHQVLHQDHALPGLRVFLYKNVPFGAGLGGGSSDAAFALKLMRDMFLPQLSDDELKLYAGKLGSDCPFFIEGRPAFAHGRGELLESFPLDLKGLFIVLIKPEPNVSTAEAYTEVTPCEPGQRIREILTMPVDTWKMHLTNDFEASVFKKYPVISEVKNELYRQGALYASMSGSGSCVYGLFRKAPDLPQQLNHQAVLKAWL